MVNLFHSFFYKKLSHYFLSKAQNCSSKDHALKFVLIWKNKTPTIIANEYAVYTSVETTALFSLLKRKKHFVLIMAWLLGSSD